MKLEDIPEPSPGPGQVVVRLHAAGVNPVDTYIRAGTYAAFKPSLPYIPGSDGAGTVEALGSGVTGFKTGDRVYVCGRSAGTYAEMGAYGASEVHPLAGDVSFEQGAAVGVPYATAHRSLFGRGNAKAGETVLVHGASGGVGTAAVQLARAAGMTVVGTAGTDEGLQLVREVGAHHAVSHHSADSQAELMALTDGRGYDVIVEMLANVNLDRDLALLAKKGRVVIVGNRGRIEIDPRQTMGKDSSILGMLLWNSTADELAVIHADVSKGLANGTLTPVVGRRIPLAEAGQAHEAVMKPGALGKIVLVIR
jgi:NADPH2:quinone reductase